MTGMIGGVAPVAGIDGPAPIPPTVPYSVLGHHLAPIADLLDRDDISEIVVNEPGAVWFERAGAPFMERRDQPDYTSDRMMRLANATASQSGQRISDAAPLLSARIPDVGRVQLVSAPVVESGVALAIRRSVKRSFSLEDYRSSGMFEGERLTAIGTMNDDDQDLLALYRAGDIYAFIQRAVRSRKNIVVSGGTSSGKTTFANALLGAVEAQERIITIEDTRELTPPQGNHLALIASRGGQNRAKVDAVTLLEASLRLRPDRIILGELRGVEAYPFIRAINTGHPGAITTIHADTPGGALDQIAFLVLQYGMSLDLTRVREYVARQIDVIIQLGRLNGERRVEKVFYRYAAQEV